MDTSARKINIAIDGYSACGKSTLAQALAKKLNYIYIDSGAMYRAVTLFAIRQEIDAVHVKNIVPYLPSIHLNCSWKNGTYTMFMNGEDVSKSIRFPEIQDLVSPISTVPEVRSFLVDQQKKLARQKGVVMDGRDIGTRVLPEAELKIFMTADIEVRTQRRYDELISKGIQIEKTEIEKNLAIRDHIDSTREDSPLKKADDAVILDNSHISQEEQLNLVLFWVEKILESKV